MDSHGVGGPYAQIRSLREMIHGCEYELGLLADGMKRPTGKRELERLLKEYRQEVRTILAEEKKKPEKVRYPRLTQTRLGQLRGGFCHLSFYLSKSNFDILQNCGLFYFFQVFR